VSKPSASKKFKLAGWVTSSRIAAGSVVAVAVLATVAITAGPAKSSWHRSAAAVSGPFVSAPAVAAVPSKSARIPQTALAHDRVRARYAALPLAFEANEGQTDPQVKYMARGKGYTLFLTSGDAVLSLASGSSSRVSRPKQVLEQRIPGYSLKTRKLIRRPQPRISKKPTSVASLRIHMLGGNDHAQIVGEDMMASRVNYFIGNDPHKWRKGISEYARVSYKDVYPGVNLAYHGRDNRLEFDFIVAPGANPNHIALSFPGTHRLAADKSGNLVLLSSAGDLTLQKPVAYQERDGIRQTVDAQFVLQADRVRFELGNYDRSRELVIDPQLSYASYLGGNGDDVGLGIALDGSLNSYITGSSDSTSGFPGVNPSAGGFDAFVVQIKPDGTLGYTTFVGGSADDFGNAIAVDSTGAYVAGITTSTDFPAAGGAQSTPGSLAGSTCPGGGGGNPGPCTDAFAFKLDSTGAFVYGTYIGGNDFDDGFGIAIDGSGHAYVTGDTFSTNFPTVNPIFASLNNGAGINASNDAFVTEISADGSFFVYSTFLGGTLTDLGNSIAVDSSGDAFVAGETFSPDFVVTNTSVCGTDGNCNFDGSFYYFDAFVTKISPIGASVLYSTYMGGSSDDGAFGVAIDGSGSVYITGFTSDNNLLAATGDFPVTAGAFQPNYGGGAGNANAGSNAFVAKIDPATDTVTYSSYLGGSTADVGIGIAVDSASPPNAYVTGTTLSSDFPMANAFQPALSGTSDAFVSEVSPTGTVLADSSYLGGTGDENYDASNSSFYGGAIAVDPLSGNAYLTGSTTSSSGFPVTAGTVVQSSYGGDPFDAFAASTAPTPGFSVAATTPAAVNAGTSGTSTVTLTSLNGYALAVNLSCTVTGGGSPAPACSASSFSPNPLTPTSAGATSTLTVTTTGASAAMYRSSGMIYALWLPIVGLSLVGMRLSPSGSRRKRLLGLLLLGLVMAMLFFLPACGGSSSSGGGGGGGGCTGCTPAGSYTVTITGTDANNLSYATAVTLTVN
jgi:hypothetical protein